MRALNKGGVLTTMDLSLGVIGQEDGGLRLSHSILLIKDESARRSSLLLFALPFIYRKNKGQSARDILVTSPATIVTAPEQSNRSFVPPKALWAAFHMCI